MDGRLDAARELAKLNASWLPDDAEAKRYWSWLETIFPVDKEDDGICVQRVVDGEPSGKTYEFVWECGARYFK